jgi:predicted ester cyclase
MSEANKLLLRQFLDLYNQAAWDRLDLLTHPDYIHHNNDLELGLAQFKLGAAWIRGALPDFRIEVEDMVSEDDKVAVRFVGRGTHLGSMFGEAPTGRPIALHGLVVYRIQDNLVAEDWEAMDEHDLRKQVGATDEER